MRVVLWLVAPVLVVTVCMSASEKRQQPSPADVPTSKPDELFPCWNQSWQCGEWASLTDTPPRSEVTGTSLLFSVCGWCNSIRLINPKDRTQRIIQSFETRLKPCKHRWQAGFHKASLEPIETGDLLFVIYENRMYALMVQKVSVRIGSGDEISYEIAKLTDAGRFTTSVRLQELSWKSRTAERQIPIGDRKIPFVILRVPTADNAGFKDFVSIYYDRYCGGWWAPSDKRHETPTHLAIVHKADFENSPVVDLTKFRFKTWEDGLGNRCDTSPPKPLVADDDVSFFDMHDGAVRSVVASPDGSYIASAGDDGCVVIKHLAQSIRKIIGPFHKERLLCLAVSADGTTLLAGGEYDLFRSILNICARDGRYEEIRIDGEGSMDGLFYYNDDQCIAYMAGANKLSFFDLRTRCLLGQYKVFGGVTWDITASPDGGFFAVISQNQIGNKLAEPCKLTVVDRHGTESLSHVFETGLAGHGSKVEFLTAHRLAVCLAGGEMQEWGWSPQKHKWTIAGRTKIPPGPFSAVASSPDAKTLWLASGESILAVDLESGEKLHERHFDIAKPHTHWFSWPITAIELMPSKGSIALGFCDGRVALMTIPGMLSTKGVK